MGVGWDGEEGAQVGNSDVRVTCLNVLLEVEITSHKNTE
jgi:hypothetical protein